MKEKDQKTESWGWVAGGGRGEIEKEGMSSYRCAFSMCLWGWEHTEVKREAVSGDSEAVTPKNEEENMLLYPTWGRRSRP